MRTGPALKTLLFSILVPGSVAGFIPLFLVDPAARVWRSPFAAFGWLLIAVGAFVYLVCAFDFSSAGDGTPAPIDPPRNLVHGRLYRITRNPMYLGVAAVVIGEAIVLRSTPIVVYCLFIFIACHLFVVFYEEPTLRRKFGDSYEQYCREVPRWLGF